MTVHQSTMIPACETLTVVPRKGIRRLKNGIYKRKLHFLQAQRVGGKLEDRNKCEKDHSQTESAGKETCENTERKRASEVPTL